MIDRPTDLAKFIIGQSKDVKIAVDMTAGNGNDSKFILENLKPETLYAFDIQKEAMDNTLDLLGDTQNFKFILDSHENIEKYIQDKVDLVVYNLGYLPRGDKNITTHWESTVKSLEKVMELLSEDGKIIMTIYPGHLEGKKESDELANFFENLDPKEFTVLTLKYKNKPNNPPYVCVIARTLKSNWSFNILKQGAILD